MLEIRNRTPYVADVVPWLDVEGRDFVTVVVKGTFSLPSGLAAGGGLPVADEQMPLVLGDEFYGDPATSSIRYEADVGPLKGGTDVVLVGQAWAPGRPVRELDVSLEAGPLRKTVRVFGNRLWKKGFGGLRRTDPEPFDQMPLVYERAFGGPDPANTEEAKLRCEERNPVGAGFTAAARSKLPDGLPLPNLEDPAKLLRNPGDRPVPAGFGFIGRNWEPRKSLAGTYDDAWLSERCPLLPRDFDPRHHRSAHPDLCAPAHFLGGEPVVVRNASAGGELRFSVPGVSFDITAQLQGQAVPLAPAVDTVLVEPDLGRVVVTWKAELPCTRKVLLLDYVWLGQRERWA